MTCWVSGNPKYVQVLSLLLPACTSPPGPRGAPVPPARSGPGRAATQVQAAGAGGPLARDGPGRATPGVTELVFQPPSARANAHKTSRTPPPCTTSSPSSRPSPPAAASPPGCLSAAAPSGCLHLWCGTGAQSTPARRRQLAAPLEDPPLPCARLRPVRLRASSLFAFSRAASASTPCAIIAPASSCASPFCASSFLKNAPS
jgi:hypothetical protein